MCLRRKYHPNYQHSSRIPPNGALLLHCLFFFIHVTFDLFLPAFVRNGVNVRIVNTLSTLKHHEVLTEDQDPFHFYFFCLYIRFPRALMFTTVMIDDGAKAGLSPMVVVVGWVKRPRLVPTAGGERTDARVDWVERDWVHYQSICVGLASPSDYLSAPRIFATPGECSRFTFDDAFWWVSTARLVVPLHLRQEQLSAYSFVLHVSLYFISFWFDLIWFFLSSRCLCLETFQ